MSSIKAIASYIKPRIDASVRPTKGDIIFVDVDQYHQIEICLDQHHDVVEFKRTEHFDLGDGELVLVGEHKVTPEVQLCDPNALDKITSILNHQLFLCQLPRILQCLGNHTSIPIAEDDTYNTTCLGGEQTVEVRPDPLKPSKTIGS